MDKYYSVCDNFNDSITTYCVSGETEEECNKKVLEKILIGIVHKEHFETVVDAIADQFDVVVSSTEYIKL